MLSMFKKTFLFLFFFKLTISSDVNFTFNGFSNTNLSLDGVASITSNGLLELTNTTKNVKGHAFYPIPVQFKSAEGKLHSFSTTFVFAILSNVSDLSGDGIAFLVSGSTDLSTSFPPQYLGLLNPDNNGNSTNHVFAVELDTVQNPELQDVNDNHIGIDINSMMSNMSRSAGYYDGCSCLFENLTLISGQPMQVWVDFDGEQMQLNVTLSPVRMPKPNMPLLSSTFDLASLMLNSMHVGFSSASGPFHSRHYILGWSYQMNGEAGPLDYAKLPSLPVTETKGDAVALAMWLPVTFCSFLLLVVVAIVLIVRRRIKYAELLEDWELDYGPQRFSYKDLFKATQGFKEKELLGTGGFGRVYRGVLPTTKVEVAVKKVSHQSRQGMREFVAEIVSIGQLRHRNLVQLLGYCRRKGELILVYDFMPNGSLDKFLYDQKKPTLSWAQRFRIIKGVASGILYLHEDWEQVVLHRDIKPSNVLLDSELNGRLGDFGLARLYDRGSDPQTTHVVGTRGYLAPDLVMTGKATTVTDVFAFGVFLLEVVCGRKPIEPDAKGGQLMLMDWVLENWQHGLVMETIDPRLGDEYCVYEVELVLTLGLLCLHPMPTARPSMRQVMQTLDGDAELPELLPSCLSYSSWLLDHNIGFDDYIMSFSSSTANLSAIAGGC